MSAPLTSPLVHATVCAGAGNTNALIDMSPYKFAGPGGAGQQDCVSVVRAPDEYFDPVEPAHAHNGATHVRQQ